MTAVSLVTIADKPIDVVDHEGAGWVSLRRVCEAFGISPDAQRVKLQSKPWARTAMIAVHDNGGRMQEACFVHERTVPMWLANIDESRIDAEAVVTLRRFQAEAADVLADHFTRRRLSGGAVGSGAAVVARGAPVGSVFEQLAAIEQMGGMLQGLLTVARQNAEALAAVSAEVARVEGAVVEANARSADVALLVDSMAKKGVHFRESARAIKNATAYVSRRIRAEAPYTNYDWRTIYGAARNELGLARSPASSTSSPSGAPTKKTSPKPIGESIKRADQVLTYARVATKHGISGCDGATINRILNADDDANTVDVDTQALQ